MYTYQQNMRDVTKVLCKLHKYRMHVSQGLTQNHENDWNKVCYIR